MSAFSFNVNAEIIFPGKDSSRSNCNRPSRILRYIMQSVHLIYWKFLKESIFDHGHSTISRFFRRLKYKTHGSVKVSGFWLLVTVHALHDRQRNLKCCMIGMETGNFLFFAAVSVIDFLIILPWYAILILHILLWPAYGKYPEVPLLLPGHPYLHQSHFL